METVKKISRALLTIPARIKRKAETATMIPIPQRYGLYSLCLLYTSDAADEL